MAAAIPRPGHVGGRARHSEKAFNPLQTRYYHPHFTDENTSHRRLGLVRSHMTGSGRASVGCGLRRPLSDRRCHTASKHLAVSTAGKERRLREGQAVLPPAQSDFELLSFAFTIR